MRLMQTPAATYTGCKPESISFSRRVTTTSGARRSEAEVYRGHDNAHSIQKRFHEGSAAIGGRRRRTRVAGEVRRNECGGGKSGPVPGAGMHLPRGRK